MKIKGPFQDSFQSPPPPEQRGRVLKRASEILERGAGEAAGPSLLSWLFRPAVGLGLAGACAAALAFIFVHKGTQQNPPGSPFRYDPEMVRNAEMLDDLEVLLKLPGLENLDKKKWPKRKS